MKTKQVKRATGRFAIGDEVVATVAGTELRGKVSDVHPGDPAKPARSYYVGDGPLARWVSAKHTKAAS